MDCTSSMTEWVSACKKELNKIIDFVREQHENSKIRVSFVGYRDHSDGQKYRFILMDFTEDIDIIKNFIAKIPCLGGGDEPEDLTGALEKALKMNWQAQTKYAVIVCDSPCHGQMYHGLFDNYPNGDPYGFDPELLIRQFAQQDIYLYAIKIKDTTNKMFNILSYQYQEIAKRPIQFEEMGNKIFSFYIAATINVTLSKSEMGTQASIIKNALSILRNQKQEQFQATNNQNSFNNFQNAKFNNTQQQKVIEQQQILQIEENKDVNREEIAMKIEYEEEFQKIKDELNMNLVFQILDWNNLANSRVYNAVCHTFFIVKDRNVDINWKNPYIQKSQINTQIRICEEPFSKGEMRYAFYAQDLSLNQNLVAKVPKIISVDYDIEHLKRDLEITFICQHLANEFNEKLVSSISDTSILLDFVHNYIYEIQDKNSKFKYYQVENFIQGQYEKYSNNAGWFKKSEEKKNQKEDPSLNLNSGWYKALCDQSQISQAFSHYSWQATMGYLLIVDLQGVPGMLTDPQIHCLDYKRFGKGNLGYEGILKFFFTHKCNKVCEFLKLHNPKSENLPQNPLFFLPQRIMLKNMKQEVYTVCDLCKRNFKIKANILQNKYEENRLKYCAPCKNKQQESMKNGQCIDCNKNFQSSQYWFMMMRTDFPIRCQDCRLALREKNRQDLEKQEINIKYEDNIDQE